MPDATLLDRGQQKSSPTPRKPKQKYLRAFFKKKFYFYFYFLRKNYIFVLFEKLIFLIQAKAAPSSDFGAYITVSRAVGISK